MNFLFTLLISSLVGIAAGLLVGMLLLLLLAGPKGFDKIRDRLSALKKGRQLNKNEIREIRARLAEVENRTGEVSPLYGNWAHCWEALLDACRKQHAIGRWTKGAPTFVIEQPATEEAVKEIEDILKCAIPGSFRQVLLTYSSRVDIAWQLRDRAKPPQALRDIFSGECCWDLQELPELMKSYRGWIAICFTDPDHPYDAVWYNKFPVAKVGNGDMLAIDLGAQPGAVIYLSHDDGEGHGYRLGNTFEDFIDRIARIGCPGYEDWQWLPFTQNKDSMIDPQSQNAREWREWFGFESAP